MFQSAYFHSRQTRDAAPGPAVEGREQLEGPPVPVHDGQVV
jgi:hypothetical protein